MNSADAAELLVLPQLRELITLRKDEWKFPPVSLKLVEDLIADIASGKYRV